MDTRSPITSSRPAFIFLGVGAVFAAIHAVHVVGDAAWAVLGVGGGAATLVGLVRNRPQPVWAWWNMLASALLFTIGGAIRGTVGATGDLSADRNLLPDLFTFPGYILFTISLLAIVRSRGRPMQTAGISLDALIATLGLLVITWIVVLDPALQTLDASAKARLAIAAYPPLTLLIMSITARLAFATDDDTAGTRLVLAGALSLILGDVLFTLTEIHVIDLPGGLLDVPYGFAWIFLGAATLHPSIATISRPPADADGGFSRTRLGAVGLALVVPAAIIIVWTPEDTVNRVVVGVLVVLMAVTAVVRVFVALAQQQRTQRRLTRLALHDDLTGLANRTLVVDRTESMLHACRRVGQPLSLLFFDLDRFKLVNDTMGHAAGDALLIACAQRVVETMPPHALVGRLSGDEFVIVLPGVDAVGAHRHGERLREAFLAPVPFGTDQFVTVSIGVATTDSGDRSDAATLLRDADTAMYLAKERGRDGVAIFDVTMRHRHARRMDVERRLRHAIDRGELVVHYQPVVSLPLGRIDGVEALVRWPTAGEPIETSEFIAVAEESGLIATIGQLVLKDATRQVALWRRRPGLEHLRLAVNISARELLHGNTAKVVQSALTQSGLDPSALWLEITERVLLEDSAVVVHRLDEVRALGVHISVDDFGTGYSALSYLKTFPVEQVKIDRAFVAGLGTDDHIHADGRDASLVEAIIAMANALRLGVVAEGVETPEQAHRLIELGCELAQGWHFAPPASPADLDPYLRAQIDEHHT